MLQQFYPVSAHPYAYELNKDFHFAAAHYVPTKQAGKCQHLHGHTYFVNVTVVGNTLDDCGFLINFQILKQLVHDRFDHTVLNDDKDAFANDDPQRYPTTEVVARTIWERVQQHLDQTAHQPKCLQVIVRETPTSYCIYRPQSNTPHTGGSPDE